MSGRCVSAFLGDFRPPGEKMVRAPRSAPGLMGWVPIPLSTGRGKLGVASRIKVPTRPWPFPRREQNILPHPHPRPSADGEVEARDGK